MVYVVNIIPNKPYVSKSAKVLLMTDVSLSSGPPTEPIEEEYLSKEEWTKVAEAHSIEDSKVELTFPRGSYVYLQTKYRTDTKKLLGTSWQDGGLTACYVSSTFGTGFSNGAKHILKTNVEWAYMRIRWEDQYGNVICWEEDVFPTEVLGGCIRISTSCSLCGGNMIGNKQPIGNGSGTYQVIYLYGQPGYYFIPAAEVAFWVTYIPGGATIGVTVKLSAERHYEQRPYVTVTVLKYRNEILYAFDRKHKLVNYTPYVEGRNIKL